MARINFGTGGWRAIIGDEFIRSNVRLLCGALAQRIKEEGKQDQGIVIGYDRRFLSDVAAQWAAEVFAGGGGGLPGNKDCPGADSADHVDSQESRAALWHGDHGLA